MNKLIMVIELRSIKKKFRNGKGNEDIPVLNDINLSIKRGELVAIKGASGAGKSTLLNILGCLDKPSSGLYLLNGIDVANNTPAELSKLRNKTFGFVLQHFALIEDDTAIENVGIPLLFSRVPFSKIDELSMEKLHDLGVSDLAQQQVSKLSGGEKQRVAIARALVNDPSIILADEPTGALDTKNTEMIMEIFKRLNNQGKTIIVVTHDDFIAKSCKRVITLSDGKIVDDIVKK